MRLHRIAVKNYKSLHRVDVRPGPLTVLVGPNGAGKTNFIDSLDFLGLVYRFGLETAISNKAGFENVAFRRQRRSKGAIQFEIAVEIPHVRLPLVSLDRHRSKRPLTTSVQLFHSFSFRAKGSGIRAEYVVEAEQLEFKSRYQSTEDFETSGILRSEHGGRVKLLKAADDELGNYLSTRSYLKHRSEETEDLPLRTSQELFFVRLALFSSVLRRFVQQLGQIAVFRFAAESSRGDGVPTPNPALSSTGANLPALVDWLQRKDPSSWNAVMSAMREIIIGLEEIRVDYTPSKTLGLLFKERGNSRYWTAKDVSDGTLSTLAILVALVDKRISLLALEEPENSVHPWIIRQLIGQFRSLSKEKGLFVTTHSPVVLDTLEPNEVWAVYKKHGETKIENLCDLDPSLPVLWRDGKVRIAEYLDSGLIPPAVPGGVQ
jgi:predicted ATPase